MVTEFHHFSSFSASQLTHTLPFFSIFTESGKLKTKTLYRFPLIIFPDFTEIRPLLRKDDFCLVLRLILKKKNPIIVICLCFYCVIVLFCVHSCVPAVYSVEVLGDVDFVDFQL